MLIGGRKGTEDNCSWYLWNAGGTPRGRTAIVMPQHNII